MSGYILIVAVLFLGGIIAVSGDRIGTKVGKARLTLFKLRPKQTATLVTIIVGTLLSASVLTVLFAASEQLRTGIFDIQKLQSKLRSTSDELAKALNQKNYIQQELEKLRIEQSDAKEALLGINRSVKDELTKRSGTSKQLKNLQLQLEEVGSQKTTLQREVDETTRKIDDLMTQQSVLTKQKIQLSAEIAQVNSRLSKFAHQVINLEEPPLQTPHPNMRVEVNQQQDQARQFAKQLTAKETALTQLATQLRQEEQKLEVRKAQLQEKDRQFQALGNEIGAVISQQKLLDRQLSQLAKQLQDREQKMAFIDRELSNLEQEYQQFRQGNIAILRNQVMAFDVVAVTPERSAAKIVAQLLKQANQTALAATHPGDNDKDRQIVHISPDQEQQLIAQIKDGRQYVVRYFAVSNYLMKDTNVRLFADAALNQKVFAVDETLSSSSADSTKMTDTQLRQQLDLLLSSSQLRARRGGILGDSIEIGDGNVSSFIQFLEKIKRYRGPIDLKAVAMRDIYTAGPVRVKLQAIQKGKVLFST